jgi:hypothetical protein
MNIGALATIAVINPPNLAILCVDTGHWRDPPEEPYQPASTSRRWRSAPARRTRTVAGSRYR